MTASDAGLAVAVRAAVLELPAGHVRKLAAALVPFDQAGPLARSAATAAVPTPIFRAHARAVLDAWGDVPEITGRGLALTLTAAADAVERVRATQSVDIAWTGPATPEVPVRLTREVLLEVIRSASNSLILVSFAAYRVADVIDELSVAVGRGVDVRLVLEGAEADGGTLRFAASDAFSELGRTVTFYEWPLDERPVMAAGSRAAMHAKTAIADEHTALVTSANLTGHAIEANMELGLLVHGGPVPVRLVRHFRQLMVDGVLRTTK